eukprot:scaffold8904_cov149-Skeletonema_menzelii.AAC.1
MARTSDLHFVVWPTMGVLFPRFEFRLAHWHWCWTKESRWQCTHAKWLVTANNDPTRLGRAKKHPCVSVEVLHSFIAKNPPQQQQSLSFHQAHNLQLS